jgi:glycosyltransferase involved in cell wall biosynthesis
VKGNLTAIILAHNESKHLARCIRSFEGLAVEIVVVDCFSSDDTAEIARSLQARVYQHAWVNYAVQFQWALDHCEITTPWVIRIDADEYVDDDLARELGELLPSTPDEVTGYYVRRKYLFLGKWIRHGAMYPVRHLRVWRTGAGRIEQRWMDEHIVLTAGVAEELAGNIVDDNQNSVSWWIAKHNGYATREMIDMLNLKYRFMPLDDQLCGQPDSQARRQRRLKQTVYSRLPLFVRPVLYFVYRYVVRLGFLDGRKGFAFHFMQGLWYRILVDLKCLEAEKWMRDCQSAEEMRTVLAKHTGLAL